MLFGEFNYQIDEKNRARVPSKLKKSLGSCSILKGSEGCLYILPVETLNSIYQKVQNIPMFSVEQAPVRMLFSSAAEIEEDNQGRFVIPSTLKEFAGIIKDIVFVGAGTRVELWSAENWNKYKGLHLDSFDNLVKKLEQYGI